MQSKPEPYRKLIIAVSIIIPVTIAALFGIKVQGYDFYFLPPIYATINAITAMLLISAFLAIKNGKRLLHERIMKTCIGLSVCFLVLYVIYHMTSETTHFGGTGLIRYVYLFILATHIILSIVIIPMVLFSFVRALSGDFERHKKLSKVTFPLWMYVAVTGVVVYLMISPYMHHS